MRAAIDPESPFMPSKSIEGAYGFFKRYYKAGSGHMVPQAFAIDGRSCDIGEFLKSKRHELVQLTTHGGLIISTSIRDQFW
jgi:hypothetical protein